MRILSAKDITMLNKLRLRLQALFFKSRLEEELDEEVRFHLEREVEENIARGMSPEEARMAALRSFGGVERVKEESRDERGVRLLEEIWQDLRYGVRMFSSCPGFTLAAIIALALGVGANTAIFSVVNALLIRPLPYKDPDQLVMVWEHYQKDGSPHNLAAPANLIDWKEQNHSFEGMAAFSTPTSHNFTGGDAPERIVGIRVSAGFFQILGVKTEIGRLFIDEEDQPNNNFVFIIAHSLWQRRFGGDPNVINKTFMLSGRSHMLVGVLPPSFKMPPDFQYSTLEDIEMWTPLALPPEARQRRSSHPYNVIARLRPGVTLDMAQTEMNAIANHLQQVFPGSNKDWGVAVSPMKVEFSGRISLVVFILFGAVCFVLLIACANVANLLLARATVRQKEIALRSAIGATRLRLIRQMLTESVLLALLGGLLGALLARLGVSILIALRPGNIPRIGDVNIDGRVLAYTLIIAVLAGVFFGLAPALHLSKPNINENLGQGSWGGGQAQRSNRLRGLLVLLEIALALVLLVGAGLMIRSFLRLRQVNPGFNCTNVLAFQMTLPSVKYKSGAESEAFYEQVLQRLKALPGVEAAARVSELPFSGDQFDNTFTIEGRPPASPGKDPHANLRIISHDYFRVMGIPFRRGRAFTEQETSDRQGAVIINEAMAGHFWAGEDPIGKRMTIDIGEKGPRTIVGVVGDIRHYALNVEPKPEMYVLTLPMSQRTMNMVVRFVNNPESLAASARREVQAIDKDQPIYSIATMEKVIDKSVADQRFIMLLLSILASVALILAVVGIFAVMSYWVTQRTHEFGIRMALGAQRRDILKLVIGEGMVLTGCGVALGIIIAFILTRIMSGTLYQVSTTDLISFFSGSLLLGSVALLATVIPGYRATKVDPMVALRAE
jgi:putative ABC transport system permease protein